MSEFLVEMLHQIYAFCCGGEEDQDFQRDMDAQFNRKRKQLLCQFILTKFQLYKAMELERTRACISIQAWWRGVSLRKEVQAQRQVTIYIQAWWRGAVARKKVQTRRQAAIRIQALWRATCNQAPEHGILFNSIAHLCFTACDYFLTVVEERFLAE